MGGLDIGSLQAVECGACVAQGRVEIEDAVERSGGQQRRGLGVGLEQLPQRQLVVERAQRVALDDRIGRLAGQAGLDEREQDAPEKVRPCAASMLRRMRSG